MIILRRLFSELTQKLFADRKTEVEYLIRCSKTTTMEFLKAVEMYYYDYQDVDHWLDKATGYMLNLANKNSVDVYMAFICLLSDDDIDTLVGQDGLAYVKDYYKANTRSDILNQIKSAVKKKYKKIEEDNKKDKVILFSDKDQFYFDVIKYVTLCVCEEIKPKDWSNRQSWINLSIPDINNNKSSYNKFDNAKLHDLLLDCVEYVLYVKQN